MAAKVRNFSVEQLEACRLVTAKNIFKVFVQTAIRLSVSKSSFAVHKSYHGGTIKECI